MRAFLQRLKQWLRPLLPPRPIDPHAWRGENATRIERLRREGVRIGQDCIVLTDAFSTEPYLVDLGDHVAVAGGVQFLTHDGSAYLVRKTRPAVQHFGRIVVGSNTYIGQNSLILAGTRIGSDCIVGAGSVVRGVIPDNSLVMGNPARVVGRASLSLALLLESEDTFDSLQWPAEERRRRLESHFLIAPANPPHPRPTS